MAQLSDDCFAFGGALLGVHQAVEMIRARVPVVKDVEVVLLAEASGRVLAADIQASIDVPSFDNSAVDGYAVRHCDLDPSGKTVLPVTSRLPAGASAVAPIQPATAVRIFTGAPMPAGADTVFMQEDVTADGEHVILPPGLKAGANRRFAGEDFRKGGAIVQAGTRLDPRHVAALAAVGVHEAPVRRRVRVALFSTGEEIIAPGQPLRPGSQYDSNRFLLASLLARRGAVVTDLGILPDRRDIITAALEAAAVGHDLILTSGGVSTGEEDHIKQAVEACGVLGFWRLAIKPGRPVAMGTIRGAAFVGLPGNPVASFVTFVHVAGPLIDHMSGGPIHSPRAIQALADFSYTKKPGRLEYVRASMTTGDNGQAVVRKFPQEGAALISSLIGTDGLVEAPEETTSITPGSIVRFLPYETLF